VPGSAVQSPHSGLQRHHRPRPQNVPPASMQYIVVATIVRASHPVIESIDVTSMHDSVSANWEKLRVVDDKACYANLTPFANRQDRHNLRICTKCTHAGNMPPNAQIHCKRMSHIIYDYIDQQTDYRLSTSCTAIPSGKGWLYVT